MSAPNWAPAEEHVPHLLSELMHMDTVCLNGGRLIEQYKHCDTRRYLNLDAFGQAWVLAVDRDTDEVAGRRIDRAAALAYVEGRTDRCSRC